MKSFFIATKVDDYSWGHFQAPNYKNNYGYGHFRAATISMIMIGSFLGRNYKNNYGWGYSFGLTIREDINEGI